MSKRLRLLIILLVIVVAVWFLYPTVRWYFLVPEGQKALAMGTRQQIRDYAQKKAALELKTLEELVKTKPQETLPAEYDFLVAKAKVNYRMEKLPNPKTWTVEAVLKGFKTQAEAFAELENHYREEIFALKELNRKAMQLGLDLSGGLNVVLQADMKSLEAKLGKAPSAQDKEAAMNQAMEILNNRIDRFGVTEPQIRRQGSEQITIEVPGAADPERVRSFLMGKGSLNFHIADDEATAKLQQYLAANPAGLGPDEQPLDPNIIDAGLVVRGFYTKDKYGLDQRVRYIVIKKEIGLDGTHIKDAQVSRDPVTNQPIINFFLDKEGGEIFYKLTESNVNKTLAIVMDEKVKAGARIAEPIRDAVRMTGFDAKEASDLALVLKTAAMPVDLTIINQQAIGASMGEDAINQGVKAAIVGFALVIAFMLIYYRGAGLNAIIAVILNVFFLVAILSVFSLTLTLTALAGSILTVGMAVDANVLIYERIKEELAIGKSRQAAIKAGFSKAFWTIMDSNITTFIAAIFLSQLGTGPIQGFGVTLSIGIVSSVFTALFVSRLIFDFVSDVFKPTKISLTWRRSR